MREWIAGRLPQVCAGCCRPVVLAGLLDNRTGLYRLCSRIRGVAWRPY